MKSKEARQRGPGNIVAAAQKAQHWATNDGDDTGDLGSYFGRKERQLVPRQQVSTEPETDNDEEQHRAAKPGNLARRIVGTQKENAEHVNEQRRNHQVGGPTMNRSN